MIIALGLLTNGLLGLGCWWLACHGLKLGDWIDRLLSTAILVFGWCVLGLQFLGTLGLLAPGPLLAWSSVPFVLGLLARWRSFLGKSTQVAVNEAPEPGRWIAIMCVTLTLWTCAIMGMKSLLLPVKVVSDGPIYHLYFAIRWWKAGRLFLVASPFGESAATYFPANGDLWFTWLIATWGGERLAKVGQVPFLALAAIAAFGIARELGARRYSSVIASCWFVASTPLLIFTFEPNVDTIFVAAYLSSVYFMLRRVAGNSGRFSLLLAGLAAGLALATKPVGLVFVIPLLALFLAADLLTNRSLAATLRASFPLLLGTMLTSGFWFVRNLIVTGNPLYPLQIELLGIVLFPGCYNRAGMTQSIYYLPPGDWRALVDILMSVLDPRLVPFWLLAILGAWSWRQKNRGESDRWVWAISLLALGNVALYWIILPYRTQQRFMLHALGLAVPPLARLLDRSWLLRTAAGLLLVLHFTTYATWPVASVEKEVPWDLDARIPNVVEAVLPLFRVIGGLRDTALLAPASVGVLLFFGIGACSFLTVWALSLPSEMSVWKISRRGLMTAGMIGQLILAALLSGAIGADARYLFYPSYPDFLAGWLQLDARSGTSGTRVAYAGTNIPYYLFGTGLRNEVFYVNIDGHRDWLLHDYQRDAQSRGEPLWPNSRPGWDRARPDFQGWLKNLQEEQVSLLVVTVVNPGEGAHNIADADRFPIERQWAESRPDLFEPLYGVKERNRLIRIYRLSRPS